MSQVVAGIVISFGLVAASLYLHFKVLRAMSLHFAKPNPAIKRPMMLVMTAIFLTHVAEIALFAAAYSIMGISGLGQLSGAYQSIGVDW